MDHTSKCSADGPLMLTGLWWCELYHLWSYN